MSEAYEEDEELEEPAPVFMYIAEEAPERRRQWCADMGCYYFGGQGVDKALKAAQMIEKYLTGALPKQV